MSELILEEIIEHELRCAKRYRRFVSIISFEKENIPFDLEFFLEKVIFRECDEIFLINGIVFIIMSDTNKFGAETAMRRMKENLEFRYELRYNIVSFPFDGHSAEDLINKAVSHFNNINNNH